MAEVDYVISKAARGLEEVSKMPIRRNMYGVPTGKVSGWIARHTPGHGSRARAAQNAHFEARAATRQKEFVANYQPPPPLTTYRAKPSAESNRIQRARESENARRAQYDSWKGPKPEYRLERH